MLLNVDVEVRVHSVLKQQKHKSSIDQTSERDRLEWYMSCDLSYTSRIVVLHSSLKASQSYYYGFLDC